MFFRLMPYSPVTAHWYPGQGGRGWSRMHPRMQREGPAAKPWEGPRPEAESGITAPLAGDALAPVGAEGDEGEERVWGT